MLPLINRKNGFRRNVGTPALIRSSELKHSTVEEAHEIQDAKDTGKAQEIIQVPSPAL